MSMTTAAPRQTSRSSFVSWRMILAAFVVALLAQLFVVQTTVVTTMSMEPTLDAGDHVLIDKLAYGYSRYSFSYPGLGLDEGIVKFQGRFAASSPKRGDLVVFRDPAHKGVDEVRRLIGLPGDKIEVRAGVLVVNGEPVERKLVEEAPATDNMGQTKPAKEFAESLSSRASYHVRTFSTAGSLNNTKIVEVPAGQYFVLGDNRDVAIDSRYPEMGMIPAENLIGRAVLVLYSDKSTEPLWHVWTWGDRFRLSRTFTTP